MERGHFKSLAIAGLLMFAPAGRAEEDDAKADGYEFQGEFSCTPATADLAGLAGLVVPASSNSDVPRFYIHYTVGEEPTAIIVANDIADKAVKDAKEIVKAMDRAISGVIRSARIECKKNPGMERAPRTLIRAERPVSGRDLLFWRADL